MGRYVLADYWVDGYAEGEEITPVPEPVPAVGGAPRYLGKRQRELLLGRRYAVTMAGGLVFGGTGSAVFIPAGSDGPAGSIADLAEQIAYQEFRRRLEIERDDMELLLEL